MCVAILGLSFVAFRSLPDVLTRQSLPPCALRIRAIVQSATVFISLTADTAAADAWDA